MTTNTPHPKTRRRLRLALLAAAILATLAAYDAAQPAGAPTALRPGSVRLIDDSTDQAEQQMLQSMQQAQQQNDTAEQQFNQDMQQQQTYENQFNNP